MLSNCNVKDQLSTTAIFSFISFTVLVAALEIHQSCNLFVSLPLSLSPLQDIHRALAEAADPKPQLPAGGE